MWYASLVDGTDQFQVLFLVLQTSLMSNLEGKTFEYECSGNAEMFLICIKIKTPVIMHLNYTLVKKKISSFPRCFSGFQVIVICRMDSTTGGSSSNVIKICRATGLSIRSFYF